MLVNFTKMHALGNDFVVIDNITQNVRFNPQLFKQLSSRRFGIGCDQILIIYPPLSSDTDFMFKIFNPNGKEAEQCGNGARCVAKLFRDLGLTNKTEISMQCRAGILQANLQSNSEVTIDFGIADPDISQIELAKPPLPDVLHCVDVGNPHAVCIVNSLEDTPIYKWGKELSNLDNFNQKGINVSFMQVVDSNYIRLRVFERGAGLTPACGSGALAASVVGGKLGLLANQVTVEFPHGKLKTYLSQQNKLCMVGPTFTVYHGCFRI